MDGTNKMDAHFFRFIDGDTVEKQSLISKLNWIFHRIHTVKPFFVPFIARQIFNKLSKIDFFPFFETNSINNY